MPLVQHNHLPSIERVRLEGINVCTPNEVDSTQPELRVGFLNMMPDSAIAATERQFLRLLSAHNQVNCYVYPFSIEGIERSAEGRAHVKEYYTDFVQIQSMKLHALVITGANITQPLLTNEPIWGALENFLLWANENVQSTLCSCLATHAAAKIFHGIDRKHLGQKCWGVFEHSVVNPGHMLVRNIEQRLSMCHSRFNDVSANDLKANNVDVLISSEQVGVQLAAESNMRMVYFQGHPEYDDISLLKEYKREVARFITKQREDFPLVPEGYFTEHALRVSDEFKQLVLKAKNREYMLTSFPEEELQTHVQNQWKQPAQRIFKNWLHFLAY